MIENGKGERHLIRAVDYLEGTPLARSPNRRRCSGASAASSAVSTERCRVSAMPAPIAISTGICARPAARAPGSQPCVDAEEREICDYFLDRFETGVAPQLAALRASVIHNDANDWNVLVAGNGQEISGLIDFGDALHTALICELAVAAAYAILETDDPLGAVAHMIGAYHEELPLLPAEVDLLFDLIAMRLVTSVTISAERRPRIDGNPYLNISEKPAWDMLRRLAPHRSPYRARRFCAMACGFEVAPGARRPPTG